MMQTQKQDSAFSIVRIEPLAPVANDLSFSMSRQGTVQNDANKLLASPKIDDEGRPDTHTIQPSFLADFVARKYFDKPTTPKGPALSGRSQLGQSLKLDSGPMLAPAPAPSPGPEHSQTRTDPDRASPLNKLFNSSSTDYTRVPPYVPKETEGNLGPKIPSPW
jgi:hypothetical protein